MLDWLQELSADQVTAIATSLTGGLLVIVTGIVAYSGLRQIFPIPHVEIDPVGERISSGRFFDVTITNDTPRRIYVSHLTGRARPFVPISDFPNPDAPIHYGLHVTMAPGENLHRRLWIGGREGPLRSFSLDLRFSRHGRAARLKRTTTRARA